MEILSLPENEPFITGIEESIDPKIRNYHPIHD